jgi:hypothetical protein
MARLSFITQGYLGVFEALWDIIAAAENANGEDFPTSAELLHVGAKEIGEYLGEGAYSLLHPGSNPPPDNAPIAVEFDDKGGWVDIPGAPDMGDPGP